MFELIAMIVVGLIKGISILVIILSPAILMMILGTLVEIAVKAYTDRKWIHGIVEIMTIFMFLAVALGVFGYELTTESIEYNSFERNLYAFEDNQGFYIRGSMFSLNGEDELKYYYTLKNNDQSFKSYSAKASRSKMFYTDKSPKIKYNQKRAWFLDGKWHSKVTRWIMPRNQENSWEIYSYEFYIPEGSVQNSYNSDLK